MIKSSSYELDLFNYICCMPNENLMENKKANKPRSFRKKFEFATQVCVILFTELCLFLLFICWPKQSPSQDPIPLLMKNAEGKSVPCKIDGKKIYHYLKGNETERLYEFRYHLVNVKDDAGLMYEDENGLHPLVTITTRFLEFPWFKFFILEKQNEYVVFYYTQNHKVANDMKIEGQPFSKKLTVKNLNFSLINIEYLKRANCFMGED